MKLKRKAFGVLVVLILGTLLLTATACRRGGGSGGVPDVRYEARDTTLRTSMPVIVIDGDSFTMIQRLTNVETTLKFTFADGKLTFTEDIPGIADLAVEYRDGTLRYMGIVYTRVEN